MVAGKAIFSNPAGHADWHLKDPNQLQAGDGPVNQRASPQHPWAEAGRLSGYWEVRPSASNLSESAKKLVEASWRGSTEKRYSGAWQGWLEWCSLQGIQAASPTLNNILDYLASLYDSGAQYRTINLHRSALSSTLRPIEGFCVGQHPLVCRLLKGVYNMRPPRPKLCPSWSIKKVLDTLKEW